MCARKVRFHFSVEAISPEDNAIKIKSIQISNQDGIFLFLRVFQSLEYHKELTTLPVIKNKIKNFRIRNQFGNLIITLSKTSTRRETRVFYRYMDFYYHPFSLFSFMSSILKLLISYFHVSSHQVLSLETRNLS